MKAVHARKKIFRDAFVPDMSFTVLHFIDNFIEAHLGDNNGILSVQLFNFVYKRLSPAMGFHNHMK